MPTRSKRPCTYPGCHALVDGRRCQKHQADERDGARARGYDVRWEKFARQYLARPENAFCLIRTHCSGAYSRAVDHRTPLRVAPHRKYDETNLQPACMACHAAKSREERRLYEL